MQNRISNCDIHHHHHHHQPQKQRKPQSQRRRILEFSDQRTQSPRVATSSTLRVGRPTTMIT